MDRSEQILDLTLSIYNLMVVNPKKVPDDVYQYLLNLQTYLIKLNLKPEAKLLQEPDNIIGPVYYSYLMGDPGDGINRQILLFGDIHSRLKTCDYNQNNMNVANLFRLIAQKGQMHNIILDIFIETSGGFILPQDNVEGTSGSYLTDLKDQFKDCLGPDKSQCNEPMRIHYIDVRHIHKFAEDLFNRFMFLHNIKTLNPDLIRQSFNKQTKWIPTSDSSMRNVNLMLSTHRLDERRISNIAEPTRTRFRELVLQPLINELYEVYSNVEYAEIFNTTLDYINHSLINSITPDLDIMRHIEMLYNKLLKTTFKLVDIYAIIRILRRVDDNPPRPDIALSKGQPITHSIVYTGIAHPFSIRDLLIKLGFNLISHLDIDPDIYNPYKQATYYTQCIPYSTIKYAIDDFTSDI